ncbi:ceramidase domain-containing protein [Andreprevotia chitinilytica]|uniref:ceramidase domain-containing protein n=1 Tax=Andreprevotia chitinilytica TaxID=396808 RepID=UPI000555D41D|nr:ceramidase domain-containing protein [Andreprevotia chitinilytica]
MTTYLDHYCERTAAGAWAEPLNTATNLAFILAALYVLHVWRKSELDLRRGWVIALLITLMFAIGIGSSLWHAFATPWAIWLDTIPILLFINVYLVTALAYGLRWRWFEVFAGWAAYQLGNQLLLLNLPADTWNGSVFYMPTWLALGLLGLAHRRVAPDMARALFRGWLLFTVSLCLRSVDAAWCPVWPLGTHFMWHLLNALLLGGLAVALLRLRALAIRTWH